MVKEICSDAPTPKLGMLQKIGCVKELRVQLAGNACVSAKPVNAASRMTLVAAAGPLLDTRTSNSTEEPASTTWSSVRIVTSRSASVD